MNYIITGGTGFIGTHLTNLIKERYPNAQVYNLDIVKPGTPNPVVKDYKPALRDGQKLQSSFIEYDIRKPIENLPFTPTEDDVIFNFAAVHRTPGHEDHEYFETNIRCAENVAAVGEIKAAGIALIANACTGNLFGWVGVALDVNFGWNVDVAGLYFFRRNIGSFWDKIECIRVSLFDNRVLQQGRILCNSICCGYWQADSE